MVMGGDSCSEGYGFKSQHCILDRIFSNLFVIKIVMFDWGMGVKKNEKEAGVAHLKKFRFCVAEQSSDLKSPAQKAIYTGANGGSNPNYG